MELGRSSTEIRKKREGSTTVWIVISTCIWKKITIWFGTGKKEKKEEVCHPLSVVN